MTAEKCKKPEADEARGSWYGAPCRNCDGYVYPVRKRWDDPTLYWRHAPRR